MLNPVLALVRLRSRNRPRSRLGVRLPGRSHGAGNTQIARSSTAVSGRRYYNTSQGRFLGRDPIEEQGGLHLYGFVGNTPINRWDFLGMAPSGTPKVGEVFTEEVMEDGKKYKLTWRALGSGNEGDEPYWPDEPQEKDEIVTLPKFEVKADPIPNNTAVDATSVAATSGGNVFGAPTGAGAGSIPNNSNPPDPKKDSRKAECDQARALASAIQQNINDHTSAIGQGLTFGQFVQFQNQRTTLGQVGMGATPAAQNLLAPSLISIINGVEQSPSLTAFRFGSVAVFSTTAAIGNIATLRVFWNPQGANADVTLPVIAAERFTHQALLNSLNAVIAGCAKDGK